MSVLYFFSPVLKNKIQNWYLIFVKKYHLFINKPKFPSGNVSCSIFGKKAVIKERVHIWSHMYTEALAGLLPHNCGWNSYSQSSCLLLLFFFCNAEDQTQSLVHDKHALYQWATPLGTPPPLFWGQASETHVAKTLDVIFPFSKPLLHFLFIPHC